MNISIKKAKSKLQNKAKKKSQKLEKSLEKSTEETENKVCAKETCLDKENITSKNSTSNCNSNGQITLEEIPIGQEYTISSVPDNPLLESLGFRPGKKVVCKAKMNFKGPVVCCVDCRRVAICRKIANQIKLD